MASLLDVAPSAEVVEIRGTQVEVTGISALGLASLLARFPQLQDMLAGNAEAEAIAAELPLESQVDILSAIQRQTMPSGVGAFVEKLQAMGLVVNAEDSETEQPQNSLNLNELKPIDPHDPAASPVM